MGNYQQHITASSLTGLVFAWGAHVLGGVHWLYGSVAALLATISGLLPDLDHPIGVQIRGLTGTLGVLTALAVWQYFARQYPGMPFEVLLWAVVISYVFIKYGLRHLLSAVMVHRGISHSLPACAAWGLLAYLYYPSPHLGVRLWMGLAVLLGFLSHLVLDEFCSVDLAGHRVKKSFGTALKFWAPSAGSTLAVYALLFLLVRQVVDTWPAVTLVEAMAGRLPEPQLPELPAWPAGFELPGPRGPAGSRP